MLVASVLLTLRGVAPCLEYDQWLLLSGFAAHAPAGQGSLTGLKHWRREKLLQRAEREPFLLA
jgi:hypothetical protein